MSISVIDYESLPEQYIDWFCYGLEWKVEKDGTEEEKEEEDEARENEDKEKVKETCQFDYLGQCANNYYFPSRDGAYGYTPESVNPCGHVNFSKTPSLRINPGEELKNVTISLILINPRDKRDVVTVELKHKS